MVSRLKDHLEELEDHVMPRQMPATANKRPRGRPRKSNIFDRLGGPPPWPDGLEPLEPNITEEVIQQHKFYHEQDRRALVGEKVCAAYKSGRNTANAMRKNAKQRLMKTIAIENEALISNSRLTSSAVAACIISQRKNHGLRARALWDIVSTTRKVRKAK
jgi:hypothetical protein